MNPSTPVSVARLSSGLPTVVMGDGTRCLIDNNTIWMPVGNPVGLSLRAGYQQPRLLHPQMRPSGALQLPTIQPPPCSNHWEAMPVCQPSLGLDLQLMRPEAFSCMLPQLDQPSPVPPSQSLAHVETPAISTINNPTPKVQPKQKSYLKPCKRKPKAFRPKPQPKPRIPKEKVRKLQPESKPYFVPQPLGAKHIKTQSRPLGNTITKPSGGNGISKPRCKLSFAEELLSADQAYLQSRYALPRTLPVPGKIIKDKTVSATDPSKSADTIVATVNVNPAKTMEKAEPSSDDEYDVEYLYLTKLILRKKRKPTAEPNKEYPPSHKRKCRYDNSEVPQAAKQPRLEDPQDALEPPQDSLEDLEALLAEYSSSLSFGVRHF
ncbi:uncharacterized protein [Haliotis asinina]|uniref:uncharacterized protein n=1 Tax=Haliotis asinina TaxID=109174 RepID=UPI0035323279